MTTCQQQYMRNYFFRLQQLLVLFTLSLFAAVSPLSADAPNKQILLERLYDNARLQQQLNWVIQNMTLDPQQYNLPDAVVHTVNRIVHIRYNPELLRTSIISTLDEALTLREIVQLLDWFNSDPGRKIVELETSAINPENSERARAYVQGVFAFDTPDTARMALIDSLINELDAIELSSTLAASAAAGVQRILVEVMPIHNGLPLSTPDALRMEELPLIRQELEHTLRHIYFYIYRPLSDDEIKAYLKFAGSSAMQNFQRGQVQAISNIL